MRLPDTAGQVQLIGEQQELDLLVGRLARTARVAFDTEAASFHRYVDRVYLVQVSSDNETALVDPLAVESLRPLGILLADPAIEILFHDADYDLRILDRDYGFRARNLFDTRIAAQLAGEPAVGLGSLLDKYFGVKVNKKLQRADWSRRPLSDDMIAYAADDTRYLPGLRDTLERKLAELGRLQWAHEEFRLLEDIRWTPPRANGEDAYLRIKGAKALNARQLAVLRELYQWRESTARALNRAPFRVLGNAALLSLARSAPRKPQQLAGAPRISKSIARRYGSAIMEAVNKGRAVPEPQLPKPPRSRRPQQDPGYERRLGRLKQLRNERAVELGLAPGLLCPNATLQALARNDPTSGELHDGSGELRGWQREVLGEENLIAALRGNGER